MCAASPDGAARYDEAHYLLPHELASNSAGGGSAVYAAVGGFGDAAGKNGVDAEYAAAGHALAGGGLSNDSSIYVDADAGGDGGDNDGGIYVDADSGGSSGGNGMFDGGQPSAAKGVCARGQASGGRACKSRATKGGLYCASHTCARQGCGLSKSNAVATCNKHAGPMHGGKGGGGGGKSGGKIKKQASVYAGFGGEANTEETGV